jgi:hypothetical protein
VTSWIARRVDIRPVVEGVRIPSSLYSLVAGGTAVRIDWSSAQDGQGLIELVLLVVVDQVAGLDDRARPQPIDGRDRCGQDLSRQRLLRPEGGRERPPEPVEPFHARGRLFVGDVCVGELREDGERARRARTRCKVRSLDRLLAGPGDEDAAAGAIDIGVPERRIRRPAGW